MSTGLIVIIIVAVLAIFVIGIYNKLVTLRTGCDQAFADIDVQLKQRHDLIPNLVETVKGYAAHEKETLESVIQARNIAMQAGPVEQQVQAENFLTSALKNLFALSENYPDLKANQNFLELQSELSDIENKLAAARRFFNAAVAEFNAAREQFPAILFASMLGFSERTYFDLGDEQRETLDTAPDVSF